MRIILFLALIFVIFAALLIKFLPLWVSIPIILLIALPMAWAVWKLTRFVKKLKKKFADVIPQERVCSLAAGEPFNGKGFNFAFPVPCEVSQTHIKDFEALILKPKFDFPDAPKDTMIIASTFSVEEMKAKIDDKLKGIFAQIQEVQSGDFVPTQVGTLQGAQRSFSASKDGKSIQGESVYLGDHDHAIAWVAITTPNAFGTLAGKYRELAVLIQRAATTSALPETSAGTAT